MKLSVIIPCLNAAGTIAGQLAALAGEHAEWPWEVIIADNGSTDETVTITGRYADRLPDLRVVDASARRGRAFARNAGARAATGDAFLFCDADDEVAAGWLQAMGAALAQHEFVACRIEPRKLNESWVCESHGYTQWEGLQRMSMFPSIVHAGGSTLGIRRSVFDRVGGFDENLFSLEDTDLCLRVQLAGVPLHFVPDAAIHVRYRHTLPEIYRQARTYAEWGVAVYKKSLPLGAPPARRPVIASARAWVDLLRRLPRARSRVGRAQWIYEFGWRVGRLRGGVKQRMLVP
jgi:GT2 family glycosyltransferase